MKFNFFPLNFLKSKLYSTTMKNNFSASGTEGQQRKNRGSAEELI